jgi:hypothetical protein
MMRGVLVLFALATALVGSPASGWAQAPVSVDVSGLTAHVNGGSYLNRDRTGIQARVQIRVESVGGLQLLLGAATQHVRGYKPLVSGLVLCVPGPAACGSPSAPQVPNFNYDALNVGVRRAVGPRIDVGAAIGAGRVHLTRGGSGTRGAMSLDGDVAGRVAGPVYLFLRLEALRWTEGGNTLYANSAAVGVRVN